MINTIQCFVGTKLFDIDIFNLSGILELLIRFGFNLLITIVVTRYIYYSGSKRKDYLFTFVMISSTIFLLIFLLESVKLKIGFALGLFAIFGIIRYRTNPIPIKEMTYLFIVITLAVINGMSSREISYSELILSNLIILFILYFFEKIWSLRKEYSKQIVYEKIELIKPNKKEELMQDLEDRLGIKISRVEIGEVNFLKDIAHIRVYFKQDNEFAHYTNENLSDDDDD
ncbi:MAG: DUF4956 domain-containing protein [Bacteroidales bacterium]|nr:DUF4956 domain-containing protein [Bacteroidales bacterium]